MGKIDWAAGYELAEGMRFVDEMRTAQRVAYTTLRAVVVRRAGARKLRRVREVGNRWVTCPLVFSPDGRTLYRSSAQLEAVDVRTGRVREVTAFEPAEQFGVTWDLQVSSDGGTLYFKDGGRVLCDRGRRARPSGAPRSAAGARSGLACGRRLRAGRDPCGSHRGGAR